MSDRNKGLAVIAVCALGVTLVGCDDMQRAQAAPPPGDAATAKEATTTAAPTTAAADGLQKVSKPSQVCMVNDRFMSVEQIPVEVEGKTYYGCCAMCKERLAKDKAVRAAKDPVSGATVDKARAVMARTPSGEIVYFENDKNLETYRQMKAGAHPKG